MCMYVYVYYMCIACVYVCVGYAHAVVFVDVYSSASKHVIIVWSVVAKSQA